MKNESIVASKTCSLLSILHSTNSKYTVQLDKLELTLKPADDQFFYDYSFDKYRMNEFSNVYILSDDLQIQEDTSPTAKEKFYNHAYTVKYQGITTGKLSTGCRVQGKNYCKLILDKKSLYNDKWMDVCNELNTVLKLTVNNIKRVDIAYDTNLPLVAEYKRIYSNSTNWVEQDASYAFMLPVTVCALDDGSEFVISEKRRKKQATTKRALNKKVVLYRKSNSEDYMRDFHAENSLDPDQINRLEVRLTSKYLNNLDVCLSDLMYPEKLKELLVYAATGCLNFKDLTSKHYDQNRNVKYQTHTLIDIDSIVATKPQFAKPRKEEGPKSLRIHKSTLKGLLYGYIQHGNAQMYNAYREYYRTSYWPGAALDNDAYFELIIDFLNAFCEYLDTKACQRIETILKDYMDEFTAFLLRIQVGCQDSASSSAVMPNNILTGH